MHKLLFFIVFATVLPVVSSLQLLQRIKGKDATAPRLLKSPRLPAVEYSRIVGLFPSFRKDAATSIMKHAEYCWENNLPGIRLSLGFAGKLDLVVDPALIEFIMSDRGIPGSPEGIFFKSALDRRGVGLLTGQGVLLSDGPDHTRKRRLILPSFDAKSLASFVSVMESVALEYATKETTTSMVNIPQLMSAIAMKIVGLCLFSTDVVDGAIYQDISRCLDHVIYVSRDPFAAPKWIPTRRNRRFRKSLGKLDQLVFSMIESGKERIQQEGSSKDLMGMLLAARYDDESGPKLSDQELRDEITTLFLAGHETTAITLSWTLWYLSDPSNSEWQDKIVQEYDQIRDSSGFTPEVIQDPEIMKYTRAVLCEALRLRSPSYAVDREVQKTIVAPGPVSLKRGDIILISPMAMHLNPKYFPNPDNFDPSRFLTWGKDPWGGPFDRSVYMPFGAGRKRCIGFRFAQWEMLIILSTLLKHNRVTRPPNRREVEWVAGVTLRPDPNLELVFEPREPKKNLHRASTAS